MEPLEERRLLSVATVQVNHAWVGVTNGTAEVVNKVTYHIGTDAFGTIQAGVTYYWRIDLINGYGTTTGDVWSFETGH